MKYLLIVVALAFGLNAQATDSGYKKVPDEKIMDYKKAVRAALAQNPNAINGCDAEWVHHNFEFVNEVLVSSTNSQPLVLFNTYYFTNPETMHRLAFFTTEDLKSITKVHAEIYQMGELNTGDLSNPVIVYDYILQGRWDCARTSP